MHRSLAMLPRLLSILLLVSAALAAISTPASAQIPPSFVASDTVYEVQLADGSTIIGRITAVSGDVITFETQAGIRVQVDRIQIRRIRPVQGRIQGGEVWTEDPHATRLFFAPTGRSLAQGEGYFGVYELFFPFLTYGITNNLVLTGGTPIVPGAIGEFAYFGPKLRIINAARTQISAGVFAGLFEGGAAGIAYGVGTWGSRDNAVTAGAGWAFWAGEGESGASRDPLVMLGGEARTGRRTKFISENYFVIGESTGVVSGGIRFWGERLSADAGVAALIGEEATCCLPVVNFVYSFGGQRR
jgi:hypothetical protein